MSDTQNNTQPADAQQNNQSGNNGTPASQGAAQLKNAPTYTQEQLDGMVNAREQRAANSALKSFFEQQGMTGEEITQAIESYKANREKNKPDVGALTAQAQQYKAEALRAKIESQATIEALKLGVDTNAVQYVLRMAELDGVADESGEISGEKLKNALSKVLEDVPALKKDVKASGFTQIGAGVNDTKPENETDRIRKAFGLKPKN